MITVEDIKDKNFEEKDFVFFWKHTVAGKGCLSQWFSRPFEVDGESYHCMEQYLMAEKARLFGADKIHSKIMVATNPMAIKSLGRMVSGYDDSVWASVRQQISVRGNLEKFRQNHDLKDYLVSTGDRILVEASPKDILWGIGLDEFSPEASNPSCWKGCNLLGFALMEVRDRIFLISADQ